MKKRVIPTIKVEANPSIKVIGGEAHRFRNAKGRFCKPSQARTAEIKIPGKRKPLKIEFEPGTPRTIKAKSEKIAEAVLQYHKTRQTPDNVARDLSQLRKKLATKPLKAPERKEIEKKAERLEEKLSRHQERLQAKRERAAERPLSRREQEALKKLQAEEAKALSEAGEWGIPLPFKPTELKTAVWEEDSKVIKGAMVGRRDEERRYGDYTGRYMNITKRHYDLTRPIDIAQVGALARRATFKYIGEYFSRQLAPWIRENARKGYDGYILKIKIKRKIRGMGVADAAITHPRFHVNDAQFYTPEQVFGREVGELFMNSIGYTENYLTEAVMESYEIEGLVAEVIESTS